MTSLKIGQFLTPLPPVTLCHNNAYPLPPKVRDVIYELLYELFCQPQTAFFPIYHTYYQNESTIFDKGNFLHQTPDFKNL